MDAARADIAAERARGRAPSSSSGSTRWSWPPPSGSIGTTVDPTRHREVIAGAIAAASTAGNEALAGETGGVA